MSSLISPFSPSIPVSNLTYPCPQQKNPPEDEDQPPPQTQTQTPDHSIALTLIKSATPTSPVFFSLRHLIETDGAGTWPPHAVHGDGNGDSDAWPLPLRAYHEIYLQAAPSLSFPPGDVSLDDQVSISRVRAFRERVKRALGERVDLDAVREILQLSATETDTENPNRLPLSPAAYNGFTACISNLRHAYRWGVIPVVRVAQEEKIIDFPEELDVPWAFIARRFEVSSMGGNVMTNYFCNFDKDGSMVYRFNVNPALAVARDGDDDDGDGSDEIARAEYNFARMFVGIERLALPIYTEMAHATTHFANGNKPACLSSLRRISTLFPAPLRIFYQTLVDRHISPKVWMHYVQGPTGWGAGEMINGEYVEYDGLSGSHIPFFRIADAFLGIEAYFDEGRMGRYVPVNQRKLTERIRECNLRERAKMDGDEEIGNEMERLVRQLRTFRAAHRGRIHKYLSAPAPERLIMTAGKSVLESEEIPEIETAIKHLDGILAKRIKETA
ncbi:uncharacterized protein BDV17DRAFT_293424 [Aspergillus undulatus]|uniref:uncharacterized protein n=1 Tax=Aspergillus undulatus TaxID=1810928 RepID=UPI003CCD34F6